MATKGYVGVQMYRMNGVILLFSAKAFHVISDTEFIEEEVPEVMKRMVDKPYIFVEPGDMRVPMG